METLKFKNGKPVGLSDRTISSYMIDVVLAPYIELIEMQEQIFLMNEEGPRVCTLSILKSLKLTAYRQIEELEGALQKTVGEIKFHIAEEADQEGDIYHGIERIEEDSIGAVSITPTKNMVLEPKGEPCFFKTGALTWRGPEEFKKD